MQEQVRASRPDRGRVRPLWARVLNGLSRPIRMAGAVYLGFILVLSTMQSQMIFPGQSSQGAATASVRAGPGAELVELEANPGGRVVALFGPALTPDGDPRPDAPSRPTILYFYGNGDCLAHCTGEFEAFRRLGANVMIAEYLGYGLSGGEAGERGCYATADAALAHLRARSDVDPTRIIAAGWSLGGAVAIDLAHREPMAGLAVFCSFSSMADMVRIFYPIPGVGLLLKHRFDNLRKIRLVTCPTLIGHGTGDAFVPASMSDRLAEAAGGPVSSFRVPSDHNDFFLVGRSRVGEEVKDLIDRVAAVPGRRDGASVSRPGPSR
ncbi:alpha/beta hydrolase [Tautonia plasticadhaerens]|uniref:Alpha/beta hydrolase family protein n=1 Tax=Tautonia plasticadhaerens TaxID=2527974 RepID=A0A518H7G4_9BACT|nr:alpha/beta hydrolase [Tautonia plasticadhaerens]QDV36731.1 Alpha/beta hydrolase family protein [Tautonia plasticadhaerens]